MSACASGEKLTQLRARPSLNMPSTYRNAAHTLLAEPRTVGTEMSYEMLRATFPAEDAFCVVAVVVEGLAVSGAGADGLSSAL